MGWIWRNNSSKTKTHFTVWILDGQHGVAYMKGNTALIKGNMALMKGNMALTKVNIASYASKK